MLSFSSRPRFIAFTPFHMLLTFPLHSTCFSHPHSIPHASHIPIPFHCFSHPHSIPPVSHIPTPFHLFLTSPLHSTVSHIPTPFHMFLTYPLPFYCLLCSHFIPCPSLSFQSFLKGIYISWVTSKPVHLEPLIAELLTDMRLPSINCLPIKKPFGALKEVVLHPIHEDTTLPYTSTAAVQLLRSIGRTNLEFLHHLSYLFIGFRP